MVNIGLCDNGNIALLPNGNIADCDACHGDIVDAINERRLATGHAEISYEFACLSYLKDKVNEVAPSYVDGGGSLYSGGSNAPTFLSSSYADSASTCSELFALVKDMLETSIRLDELVRDSYTGENEEDNTCSDAKANAEGNFGFSDSMTYDQSSGFPNYICRSKIQNGTDSFDYYARLDSHKSEITTSDVGTDAISHNFRRYFYTEAPETGTISGDSVIEFDKNGYPLPDEDKYGIVKESGFISNLSWNTADILDGRMPNWPTDCPPDDDSVVDERQAGFKITDYGTLVQWNFTHT